MQCHLPLGFKTLWGEIIHLRKSKLYSNFFSVVGSMFWLDSQAPYEFNVKVDFHSTSFLKYSHW